MCRLYRVFGSYFWLTLYVYYTLLLLLLLLRRQARHPGRECCLPKSTQNSYEYMNIYGLIHTSMRSARDPGCAVELAASRKVDKYSALERTHFFQPIAVEALGRAQ